VSLRATGWLLALIAIPIALWHRVIGDVLSSFHWSLRYVLAELSPWLVLLAAIAFLVPVAVSEGRSPASRLYPRARRAYIAWGTVLYVLGCVLAVQLTDIWSYAH
jgi:uncharacterized membrane protein